MPDKIYKRKSIRLKDWDYASEGAYYVTLCSEGMVHVFGKVVNEKMMLNHLGGIVEEEWLRTAVLRNNVVIDEFIIMPNHIHGIIMILENFGQKEILQNISKNNGRGELIFAPMRDLKSPSQTLGSIIRGFKSSSTKRINKIRNTPSTRMWQRNYYERIIRDHRELDKFRKYILENPVRWSFKKGIPENYD